jgi:hypothetical protein
MPMQAELFAMVAGSCAHLSGADCRKGKWSDLLAA